MSFERVTIAAFDSVTHAAPQRILLEREGVFCLLANAAYPGGAGASSGAAGGVWLQVRAEDEGRALRILREAADEPDDAEVERRAAAALQCPRCRSEDIVYEESALGFQGSCAACGMLWELV